MKAMGDAEQIPKDAAEIDAVSYGVAGPSRQTVFTAAQKW
jgi:hypothetical protein